MFLHLGENVVVPDKDVIGIFSVESLEGNPDNKSFLKQADEDGFVFKITKEKPKSFIVAEVEKKAKIFLSPISSQTLTKRIKRLYE